MYKVTVNGNYNVVINDIGVSIRATKKEAFIDKAQFDSSSDAKTLVKKGIIIITDIDASSVESDEVNETNVQEIKELNVDNTIFVARQDDEHKSADGIFVRQNDEALDASEQEVVKDEKVIEEIKEMPDTDSIDVIDVKSESSNKDTDDKNVATKQQRNTKKSTKVKK